MEPIWATCWYHMVPPSFSHGSMESLFEYLQTYSNNMFFQRRLRYKNLHMICVWFQYETHVDPIWSPFALTWFHRVPSWILTSVAVILFCGHLRLRYKIPRWSLYFSNIRVQILQMWSCMVAKWAPCLSRMVPLSPSHGSIECLSWIPTSVHIILILCQPCYGIGIQSFDGPSIFLT